jgi:hypothetical protein
MEFSGHRATDDRQCLGRKGIPLTQSKRRRHDTTRHRGRRSILNPGSKDIVDLSQLAAGDHEFTGASKDPDDDKYIAAAIEGREQFVVAGD